MAKVFFSWQSDRSNATGRNLIHRALVDAIAMLNSDADVENANRDEVALDSDTQGVPGSPPIVETIFLKIDASAVFVADLTFVGTRCSGRPTPNPNVTIEYGYALRALTHSRVLGVMNAAHGEPTRESLPFDLGHMRYPITYNCPDDADDDVLRRELKYLAHEFKVALKAVLDELPSEPVTPRERYSPNLSLNGEARFRAANEPVGMLHDGSPLPKADVPVFLAEGAAMWLRVMPEFSGTERLLVTQLRDALINGGNLARPLNGEDYLNPSGVRGADGYGLGAGLDGKASLLVYVFDSGEVWSIDTASLSYDGSKVFFNPKAFVNALIAFAEMLKRLRIAGPYRWIAGIDGLKGRRLDITGRSYTFPPAACLGDSVVREGRYSGSPEDAKDAIEPFIAAVFDTGHLRRS